MPHRSTYDGRHRGRHRAEVSPSPRGATRPSAAAAALTLTATGAALIPAMSGSAGAVAAADAPPPPAPAPHTETAEAAPAALHIQSARERIAQEQLLERTRTERAQAAARASRAKARAQVDAKRRAALAKAHRWVVPVSSYRFTSDFGPRWGRLHAGDDLAAPVGTRVGSLSSGTVVFAGYQSGYGLKVEVRHWDGTVSLYGHLSSVSVRLGESVTPGEKIGEVGNTGRSTGPHLHLEIHPGGGEPVDPARWLAARGVRL